VCSFVVKMIGGDPVFDDRLLRIADVEQSVTHQIAQHRFQPILGFRIPFRFDAAAGLWPEIGHVVAAAKADGHKVVDFIIGMRSRWQSIAGKNFITQRIAEVAMFAGVTADLYWRVVLDRTASLVGVWSYLGSHRWQCQHGGDGDGKQICCGKWHDFSAGRVCAPARRRA